jgi:hypothetical protein
MDLAECEACKAFMLWAISPSGARSPIDYAPSEKGNVLLLQPTGLGELLAVVLSGQALERARARGMDLRLSHFASCPNADEFRSAKA